MYSLFTQRFNPSKENLKMGFIGIILLIFTLSVQAKENKTLIVLGDSLSAAYGMDKEKGWVAQLRQRLTPLGIKVVNASISGETSSGGIQRWQRLQADYQVDYLILELGANDGLRGQNLKATERNLSRILQSCLSQNCQALLLGIKLPTNYGPAYEQAMSQMYQNLAQKHSVAFDPFFLEDVALDPDLMQADGLHPNAKAQPIILQRIWSQLKTWH